MINLKKNNILVRDFTYDDIENKVKWINDKANNQYLHYDLPLSTEKTLIWFENKPKNRLDCTIEFENIPVGLIGLIGIDEANKKAEFYISMGRSEFKRKGIATKAIELILDYAFIDLDIKKIYLNVDEENEAARRLYEKIGFNLEGFFVKDMIHNGCFINRCRYAIFAEEWLKV